MKTLKSIVIEKLRLLAKLSFGSVLDEQSAITKKLIKKVENIDAYADKQAQALAQISDFLKCHPSFLGQNPNFKDGQRSFAIGRSSIPTEGAPPDSQNTLEKYFDGNVKGKGIWKWRHYFEIYDRHFSKFLTGTDPVTLAEVGVYSGGSIGMWQQYFGNSLTIHGIDIQEDCKMYEADNVHIHIGDQADRRFWRSFREEVPALDIFIDDGGHTPEQQRITLEEMLPHVKPGGIYICEDIHGIGNEFYIFVAGIVDQFNHYEWTREKVIVSTVTPFQSCYHSVHFYPYVVVIEKLADPRSFLFSEKRGTDWQPFPI